MTIKVVTAAKWSNFSPDSAKPGLAVVYRTSRDQSRCSCREEIGDAAMLWHLFAAEVPGTDGNVAVIERSQNRRRESRVVLAVGVDREYFRAVPLCSRGKTSLKCGSFPSIRGKVYRPVAEGPE